MKSPFQYLHRSDGTIGLVGLPHVKLDLIEGQGKVVGRNWQHELNLPTYQEEWDEMAEVRGMSNRAVRFIVMDESASRLPGHPRLNPQAIMLPKTCPLELGHSGFVVGFVHSFVCGFDELRAWTPELFGIEVPLDVIEGDYIVGTARLYDSQLSDAAWQGIQRKIFSHVCAMTFMADGKESLVQVSLVCGDFPGCENARILKTWEG